MDYNYKNKVDNFINDKLKFKEHLKYVSDKKLVIIKHVILISIMIVAIILALLFSVQDVFIISTLYKIFGHQPTYNIIYLGIYIIGGLVICGGVSFLFDRHMNKLTEDFRTGKFKLPILAEKVSDLILLPIIFGIRDLLSSNSFFSEALEEDPNYDKNTNIEVITEAVIKRLYYFMTDEYGYTDTFAREKIEEYFEMDFNELSLKVNKLNFYMPIYKNNRTIKYDLSYLKKDLKNNFIKIIGPTGKPGTAINLEDYQNVLILKEVEKLNKILNGRIKIKNKFNKTMETKRNTNKTSHTKQIDNLLKDGSKVNSQENKRTIIEVTD